jgi:hypothetical protein
MKDFLPKKQNKSKQKLNTSNKNEIKITIEEMKTQLESIIVLMEEQLKMDIESDKPWSNPQTTHATLQAYKIMLSKITGKEYVYKAL